MNVVSVQLVVRYALVHDRVVNVYHIARFRSGCCETGRHRQSTYLHILNMLQPFLWCGCSVVRGWCKMIRRYRLFLPVGGCMSVMCVSFVIPIVGRVFHMSTVHKRIFCVTFATRSFLTCAAHVVLVRICTCTYCYRRKFSHSS